ncbi:unnamed protein product [Nippostrongylus brasiliensis]|uniref:Tetraspanin-17 (inferred by orthology to a C. elegans protein) n=1 Tax=Nippostrongylus brasiliensis TaxID=27835 RepID=A0A0N4YDP7_NIPBR|nr:unnamed protein product [Nippostrongylus brasiliensis]
MTIQRTGGDCAKIALMIYTLLFWTSGLALLFIGLWMLLDPKRNYILNLVDFSEDDPLLSFYIFLQFMICLFVLFLADVSIGTLALVFRNKFTNGQLKIYIANMTHNRYNRDKWVMPLLDTVQFYLTSAESAFNENLKNLVSFTYGVSLEMEENRKVTAMIDKLQFYEECCGISSADDYLASRWMSVVTSDPAYENDDPPLVPLTCCRQILGASALNPVARSLARCQQSNANRNWRHTSVSFGLVRVSWRPTSPFLAYSLSLPLSRRFLVILVLLCCELTVFRCSLSCFAVCFLERSSICSICTCRLKKTSS